MGARRTRYGEETVYRGAEAWVESALRTDGSLFTPGKTIWSSQWLGELRQRFLDQPNESGVGFMDKLERQLKGSPPEVYQLMGEVLYSHFLIISGSAMKSETKESRIKQVLGWSGQDITIPKEVADGLAPGLSHPGNAFNSYRPYQVGFLIEFAERWKEQDPNERQWLLDDPWAFKEFVITMGLSSPLLYNNQDTPRAQRHALLHLVYPDTFESIVSVSHKVQIAETFADFVSTPEEDVDRKLAQIRAGLEAQYERSGKLFHTFYAAEIRAQWPGKPNPPVDPVGEEDEPTPDEPSPSPVHWSPGDIADFAEKLSWEPEQLQDIIDDLREKRQVIFYGPPGTGKTYVARTLARQCREYGGGFEIVQFHPFPTRISSRVFGPGYTEGNLDSTLLMALCGASPNRREPPRKPLSFWSSTS